MEIGTAEPIKKKKKRKLKKRPNFSRSSRRGDNGDDNGDNGGGNNGGNKGDNIPKKKQPQEDIPQPVNKTRIMMGFLLLVVLMTFGGLIGAYIVLSTNNAAEWKPFTNLPYQVWFSTAIIFASSIAYLIAQYALLNKRTEKAKRWFLITTAFGGLFISSQLLVWLQLYNRGLYMRGNPYAGFFYILTAVHVVHVLGGIVALGYIILRTWNKARTEREVQKRNNDAVAIGWYWHTMDALWLVLLFLLAFYK